MFFNLCESGRDELCRQKLIKVADRILQMPPPFLQVFQQMFKVLGWKGHCFGCLFPMSFLDLPEMTMFFISDGPQQKKNKLCPHEFQSVTFASVGGIQKIP